jgi:Pup amidohydrolase
MGVPKILGIETEYGVSGGPEHDPILASSMLVNAIAAKGEIRVNWDFADESPHIDARTQAHLTAVAPMVETHLANTVLTNGARFYVDHAHPEYSSPETRTPFAAVQYDCAGDEVLRLAMRRANDLSPLTPPIVVYKNNSDGKGNSYGTHENYLVDRSVPFADVVAALAPHLLSRQIICGAGKVGWECEVLDELAPAFQIAQRSEFFEELVGLETTLKRPIVNTRDEPHADPERFRRLHVIIGDANMSQTATLVKVGSTAVLLAALEEWGPGAFPPMPRQPVRAVRVFGADPSLQAAVVSEDGRSYTAWDYQDQLWTLARSYIDRTGGAPVATTDECEMILRQWRELLDGVRDDRASVADRIDWVAKERLVTGYADRYRLAPTDPKLKAIDLQYHDLRPERSLAARSGLRELVPVSSWTKSVTEPPTDTRAYFRGSCLQRYPDAVVSANWDSLVFDLGSDPLRRVPMLDPLRGTREHVGALLDACPTADELVVALGS